MSVSQTSLVLITFKGFGCIVCGFLSLQTKQTTHAVAAALLDVVTAKVPHLGLELKQFWMHAIRTASVFLQTKQMTHARAALLLEVESAKAPARVQLEQTTDCYQLCALQTKQLTHAIVAALLKAERAKAPAGMRLESK